MQIRQATDDDWEQIWPIYEKIVRAGETYGYPRDTDKEQGKSFWMDTPRMTFLAEENGFVLGTYYLKTNFLGPGSHVCNCGYMVSELARGKGLATAFCQHSQQIAQELGYKAMQFNYVASSNEGAVRLWKKLGFDIVGILPKAFDHPRLGFVDAYVMYKWLTD
ncbi:N-acetyltransferase family protein [Glaciecola sp. 1036]|uniref:GNAT family N-acetyltransferase n=1 Tax=Alteromonadaceae TaxID=72275 RepID=UPI003D07FB1A